MTPVFGDPFDLNEGKSLVYGEDSFGQDSSCAWVSSKGDWRPVQEDRFVSHSLENGLGRGGKCHIAAVFDGHGGSEVAHQCA